MRKTANKLTLTNKTARKIAAKTTNKTPKIVRKVKIKTLTNKPLTPKIKQAKLNKKSKKNRRKIYPLS